MVNGQPPFVADDRWSLMDQHLHAEVPALSGGDTRLATFVRRMLSKEPDSRPTLARCREVLRTTGNAQQSHTGIAAAAAEIAQERARIEAEAARVRTREQRRAAIVRDGAAELIGVFERLGGVLRQATEDAGVSEDVLSLGGARLRRQRVEPVDVELQAVEVVAWSSLELRQMGATGGNNLLGRLSTSSICQFRSVNSVSPNGLSPSSRLSSWGRVVARVSALLGTPPRRLTPASTVARSYLPVSSP
jgi:hypothetical protein